MDRRLSYSLKRTIFMDSSELRRDLVSGDWIAIAIGRAKRPHAFSRVHHHDSAYTKRAGCPFEKPQSSGNAPATLVLDYAGRTLSGTRADREWFTQVIPNRYPAFMPGEPKKHAVGPFETMDGAGFHELVVSRDHHRHWAQYTQSEAATVFRVYRDRYRTLSGERIVQYVAIFHNFGREAGASLYHPHSQIIAIPVIPPDVQRSFAGSARYFRRHHRCVHCALLEWERRKQGRIIAENRAFVAMCPFVSRSAFEIRIFPKRHEPCFGNITDREVQEAGDILRRVLGRLRNRLGNPPYNFFIHSAPCGRVALYPHYHWHLEILPKISVWAGFEIATGIEISTIAPEYAAAFLRSRSKASRRGERM